jgi:hypothetical protein
VRYLTQEDEDTCRDELWRSRVDYTECPSVAWDCFSERTQVQLQSVRRHEKFCDLDDGLGQKFIGWS